jgi:hypothetical protein
MKAFAVVCLGACWALIVFAVVAKPIGPGGDVLSDGRDVLLGTYTFTFEPESSVPYETTLEFEGHSGAERASITVETRGGVEGGFCDHPWPGDTVIPTARLRPFCDVDVETTDHEACYTPADAVAEFDGWSEIVDSGFDTCGDGNRVAVEYELDTTRWHALNMDLFRDPLGASLPIRYQQANRAYVSDGSLESRNTWRDPIVVTVRVYGQPGIKFPAARGAAKVVAGKADPHVILDGHMTN